MSLKKRLRGLPFFWKVYGFVIGIIIAVVGLAEGLLEPLGKHLLGEAAQSFHPWHEAVIWAISILIPALLCGYIVSKALSEKLNKMVRVSRALAGGNLEARLPVNNNDKDDFDLLARSFNEMAASIERQMRNERRLLADISHEIRTPLTRLLLEAELLDQARDEKERGELVARLRNDLELLSEMAETLLAQARDNTGGSSPAGLLDLNAMLLELAGAFAFQGESEGKAVRAVLEPGLAVFGKPLLLKRMFGNLLSNALFYAPPDSEVLVSARGDGEEIVVQVRDHGPGVPEGQLDDIFRAFYRVDTARTRSRGGSGLGLALAREAVLCHGGSIEARNAAPGLELTVILPAGDIRTFSP